MEITRTATPDITTWTATLDGATISELSVWTVNGEICSVETPTAHQGNGYATALYRHADNNFRGGIFHTIDQHRTPEGDAFAHSVGGSHIGSDALVIDVCCCDHCDS